MYFIVVVEDGNSIDFLYWGEDKAELYKEFHSYDCNYVLLKNTINGNTISTGQFSEIKNTGHFKSKLAITFNVTDCSVKHSIFNDFETIINRKANNLVVLIKGKK